MIEVDEDVAIEGFTLASETLYRLVHRTSFGAVPET